jgi:ketosteroid isomerase-like protein
VPKSPAKRRGKSGRRRDVAYMRSKDSLSVTPRAGGDVTQFVGNRITIYRKQPGGSWLLARDAHTLSVVES